MASLISMSPPDVARVSVEFDAYEVQFLRVALDEYLRGRYLGVSPHQYHAVSRVIDESLRKIRESKQWLN